MRKVPIILLVYNEYRFLDLCIKSIERRTDQNFEILIVDNRSDMTETVEYLDRISSKYRIFYNEKNDWVYGFNLALDYVEINPSEYTDYYVLSDCDIIVPIRKGGTCWLSKLITLFDKYPFVGKLGLALDYSALPGKLELNDALNKELLNMSGPKIRDDLIIAPVDTTMAIYRKDLYVHNKRRMQPGHASLIKPYYYTARTTKSLQCKHLSWRCYNKNDAISIHQAKEKVRCFTKTSGYVDPQILKIAGLKSKIYYKTIGRFYKFLWGTRVVYLYAVYIACRFPRKINEIQHSVR